MTPHLRNRLPAFALSIGVFLIAALASCGGGGGGGAAPLRPVARLVAVTWSPASGAPTPAEFDLLILTFDQVVTINSTATVDDTDLRFEGSAGATLGTVVNRVESAGLQSIQIRLGAGVSIDPGTTRIGISEDFDLAFGRNNTIPSTTETVTLAAADARAPVIAQLTIEGIQDELNGEGSALGRLQTPRTGFVVDVVVDDDNPLAAPSHVSVKFDQPVLVDGVQRADDVDLSDVLSVQSSGARYSFTVGSNVVLPVGEMQVGVLFVDASGLPSDSVVFSFRTVEPDNALRPLENGQLWFLDLSRDIEAIETRTVGGGVLTTDVTEGANGRRDFDDVCRVLGLWADFGIADVGDGRSSNQVVEQLFQSAMLNRLGALFDGVDVTFTFLSPGTFPSGQVAVPYGSFGFSQICLAGAPSTTPTGTLGAALLDPRNEFQEDDCQTDFQGLRLGVFLETGVRIGLQSGPTSLFRSRFAPFAPALRGQPIGENPQDADRLLGTLTDQRADQIDAAVDALAALASLVTAHECGHSMGLVTNGAMPLGLYGGDAANFPLSGSQPATNADNHIENQSLFPAGATNVMSPALSLDAALSTATGFNLLNLAYLRERALYDNR